MIEAKDVFMATLSRIGYEKTKLVFKFSDYDMNFVRSHDDLRGLYERRILCVVSNKKVKKNFWERWYKN